MEWSTILTAIIAGLSGAGFATAIVVLVGRKWLVTFIEEHVRHQYAKKLEEHKAKQQTAVDRRATDKSLFAKLLETLPSGGSIEYASTHSFNGQLFEWSKLDQDSRAEPGAQRSGSAY